MNMHDTISNGSSLNEDPEFEHKDYRPIHAMEEIVRSPFDWDDYFDKDWILSDDFEYPPKVVMMNHDTLQVCVMEHEYESLETFFADCREEYDQWCSEVDDKLDDEGHLEDWIRIASQELEQRIQADGIDDNPF